MSWVVANARAEPKGNAIIINKQASDSSKIDPLMAAFNAVVVGMAGAVADNVGGRNRRQFALLTGHGNAPPKPVRAGWLMGIRAKKLN